MRGGEMDGQKRKGIRPGLRVAIVRKQDQRTAGGRSSS